MFFFLKKNRVVYVVQAEPTPKEDVRERRREPDQRSLFFLLPPRFNIVVSISSNLVSVMT